MSAPFGGIELLIINRELSPCGAIPHCLQFVCIILFPPVNTIIGNNLTNTCRPRTADNLNLSAPVKLPDLLFSIVLK
jgi:hypothetical protein